MIKVMQAHIILIFLVESGYPLDYDMATYSYDVVIRLLFLFWIKRMLV